MYGVMIKITLKFLFNKRGLLLYGTGGRNYYKCLAVCITLIISGFFRPC